MRYLTLLAIMLFLYQLVYANPTDFSDKEKGIIYTNSLQILGNYELLINEIGVNVVNNIEKAKSTAESLIELFINRQVLVYNDLDPSYKLSKFYEVETYASNMILWYPDGVKVSLDIQNARVSNILQHENNVFSMDILLKKEMNGNYLNKTFNKNSENITFRLAFSRNGKNFDNFKIVGIRNAESKEMIDYSKALKEVNSEDLKEEELIKVYDGIKSILGDYGNFLALLGDPDELDADKTFYRESFTNLFKGSDIKIYNDINPAPDKSLIDVTSYLDQYKENFPNGIKNNSLNIDSAEYGKVIKAEDGSFYTYAYVDKFFSGSFKGKEAFSKMFPLVFKISFEGSGKAYINYRIASVDISGSGFFAENANEQEMPAPNMVIKPVSRKGLSLMISGSYGLSYIKDQNISSLTLQQNNYQWSTTNEYGYSLLVGAQYFINDNINLCLGIGYNTYSASFSLDGSFQDDEYSTDINGDLFYKIITASLDSLVTVNYISMPVYLNYTSGKPGKIGFYVDAGIHLSYLISSNYSSTGNYEYTGYYPSNPSVIKNLSEPELGFYSREYINVTDKTDATSLSFSFYGSIGINIPFGYYSSFYVGPEIVYGLSDIMKDRTKYTDVFGYDTDNKATKIEKFGLKIGFVYKL